MTCVARDARFSSKDGCVHVDDHLHHLARSALGLLVVTIPYPATRVRWSLGEIRRGLHVTVVAMHTEGRRDEIHQRKELAFGKRAQHLELGAVSYTHLRAHETPEHLVCRLL